MLLNHLLSILCPLFLIMKVTCCLPSYAKVKDILMVFNELYRVYSMNEVCFHSFIDDLSTLILIHHKLCSKTTLLFNTTIFLLGYVVVNILLPNLREGSFFQLTHISVSDFVFPPFTDRQEFLSPTLRV